MSRHPHEILLDEFREQFKAILDGSKQAIYVYLDNEHKICNARFATLLGYKSEREWETLPDPMVTVAENSINTLVSAYQNAMQDKIAAIIDVSWIKNGGGTIKSNIIIVPIAFKNELMGLHFITAK